MYKYWALLKPTSAGWSLSLPWKVLGIVAPVTRFFSVVLTTLPPRACFDWLYEVTMYDWPSMLMAVPIFRSVIPYMLKS